MAEPFLIGDKMTGGYGKGANILQGCTVAVEKGEIAVIVGPNGAGKSTAMKAIFGMLNLREGSVRIEGEDITALTPQARVAKGMAFVPQTHNIFTSMTVEENLEMGAFLRRDDIKGTMEQVFTLFPILRDKRRQAAGELSGGQRQQVAVGRALMTQPKVLMLDEPTAGVSPIVMDELFDRIIEVSRAGITILMVEQNARQALEIADKGYVLVQGGNAFTGTGQELLADPQVRKSFLGMMPNVLAGTVTVIALSVALGASSALAEGARETYDCVSTQRCDGAGLCEPADEAITFVVAPLSRDAQGGGTLTLSYGDETAQATRLSDIAPIVWSSGPGDVQSLMITGSAMFVWYWLDLNYGNSELTFLTCKVSR